MNRTLLSPRSVDINSLHLPLYRLSRRDGVFVLVEEGKRRAASGKRCSNRCKKPTTRYLPAVIFKTSCRSHHHCISYLMLPCRASTPAGRMIPSIPCWSAVALSPIRECREHPRYLYSGQMRLDPTKSLLRSNAVSRCGGA